VVQFHPPKSQYVNCHPYCLHLWRNKNQEVILPPSILVGPKIGAQHGEVPEANTCPHSRA
jgi:hypothetical protein